jgi:OmpA family protein
MRVAIEGLASVAAVFLVAAVLPGSALGQYVYPGRGQSPQQQQQDQADCSGWAMQQAGNPAGGPPPPQGGQVLRGAGRGAAVGVVGGAIAGDPGKGAAIGAASGALIGGMRRRDEQAAYQQAQTNANAAYSRAYAACLEGRGYTVK